MARTVDRRGRRREGCARRGPTANETYVPRSRIGRPSFSVQHSCYSHVSLFLHQSARVPRPHRLSPASQDHIVFRPRSVRLPIFSANEFRYRPLRFVRRSPARKSNTRDTPSAPDSIEQTRYPIIIIFVF